jgi:PAS domain S-box-containing protein/putative nucleotidyltransferase with HDIG domain
MEDTTNMAKTAVPDGATRSKHTGTWDRLLEPAASIHGPERRRRARLLSALLATQFLLALLATVLILFTIHHPSDVYIVASAAFILAIAYYLSRTRHYNLAALLAVGTLSGSVFAAEVFNPDPGSQYFLILGVLMGSLFLSRRDTALITAAIIIGIGLLFWASFPTLSARDVIGAMFAVLCVGALGIVAITIRQRDMEQIQEQDHLLIEDIAHRNQIEQPLRESEQRFRALVEYSMEEVLLVDADGTVVYESPNKHRSLGYSPNSFVGRNLFELFHPDDRVAVQLLRRIIDEPGNNGEAIFRLKHQDGSWCWMEGNLTNLLNEPAVRAVVINYRDITQRQQAEEELRRRLADFEAVNQLSTAMRGAQTLDQLLPIVLDVTLDVLHAPAGSIWLYDKNKDELRASVTRGYHEQFYPSERPGDGIAGYVFATRQPFIENDFHLSPQLPEAVRQNIAPGRGGANIPIRAGDNVIGTFSVTVSQPRELTPNEIHLLTILSEIAGNAIQRLTLHRQTERRLQHLAALSEIDQAIISGVDLRNTLGILLDQALVQLGVDAGDVLLCHSNSLILECIAERGFLDSSIKRGKQRLDNGYAGQSILDRRIVKIENIRGQQDDEFLAMIGAQESFISYYAVPLIAKGPTKGVLEIFKRAPYPAPSEDATGTLHKKDIGAVVPAGTGMTNLDEERLGFLNTLATQAAIAIDNVTLFDDLQRSNNELSLAYDATIEGWSHALDLRDKETEGHTLRVAELTVKLARNFSLNEAELAQVRWGALLHDIGKMGIPDAILHKPGPLTEEEWIVMRKHPTFANEMLLPIQYLSLALDIPYCHHEKWDGTGYPRGLKSEQIPFAARIFAIVDVWDALTSDRPYRAAWPAEKVIEHIRSLGGSHFDPEVLKVCLESGILADLKRE